MEASILHPNPVKAPAAGLMVVVYPEPQTIEQRRLEDEKLNARCEGVGECPVIKDMRRGI